MAESLPTMICQRMHIYIYKYIILRGLYTCTKHSVCTHPTIHSAQCGFIIPEVRSKTGTQHRKHEVSYLQDHADLRSARFGRDRGVGSNPNRVTRGRSGQFRTQHCLQETDEVMLASGSMRYRVGAFATAIPVEIALLVTFPTVSRLASRTMSTSLMEVNYQSMLRFCISFFRLNIFVHVGKKSKRT